MLCDQVGGSKLFNFVIIKNNKDNFILFLMWLSKKVKAEKLCVTTSSSYGQYFACIWWELKIL